MNMPANSIPKFSSGNEIKCDKSTIIRNSSSESGTSYEAGSQQQQQQQRFIVQGNPIQDIRESSTGVSITMKTQPRNKDGSSADADRKTTTRIDFGDFYPDGGWGWVITGAATLVYVLCNGFHHAFGILYLQILEQSKKDRRPDPIDTTWLGSVGLSITYFLSPIISTICQRKSPRLYAVIGGLTCALGCLFLSFSEHMEQLFISHCVVLSLGSGITISTANVMVGRYFRRKREMAEMTMVAGTGLGTAVMSVLFQELNRKIGWTHTLQCISGLMVLSIFAGSLYRSVSMYHPRRKVIMHIKSQKKSRRDRDTERQPYFDFSALRMRALQGLMFITAIVSFGMYVPFLLLVETAKRQGVDEEMQLLINVYLGLGFLAGCLILGYIIIRDSKECSISRRHLCQTCSVACGVLTLLLLMAKDQNAFALYAWGFGIFSGGYYYTVKVYTYELVKLKIMERAWGFVCAAQFLPIMLGAPIAAYINRNYQSHTAGFIMSGVTMLCGGLLFFFMPPLEKHRSNQEIIQIAKNTCSKNSAEAAALLDLDLTEAMVTKPLNNVQFIVSPSRLKQNGKDGGKIQMQCFIHHKEKEKPRQIVLSKITEEKEGLRLDFNEVSQISTNLTKINECTVSKKEKPEIETSQSHSQSCAHASDYHSDSTHSNHTGKSSSTSTSNSSKSHEPRRFKKSMDNVRVELFDPPSQEKESTATVSYDSDLYINLCEAQV